MRLCKGRSKVVHFYPGIPISYSLPKCDKILSSVGIDRSKVLSLIRSLDSKKAHGCDDLSIAMLKIRDLAVVEPLSLIYEKCLESDKYPSLWKIANILPIHIKEHKSLKQVEVLVIHNIPMGSYVRDKSTKRKTGNEEL